MSEKRPERIHDDIRQIRSRMDDTIDRLSDRFSLRGLLDEGLDVLRSAGRHGESAGRTVGRKIRENPLPLLLIGGGIAWLFLSGDDEEDEPTYGDPGARGYATEEQLVVPTGRQAHGMGAPAEIHVPASTGGGKSGGSKLERAGEKAGEVKESAKEKAKQAASGALGKAAGAGVHLMHGASKAGEAVRGAGHAVKGAGHRARQAGHIAVDAARHGAREAGSAARSATRRIGRGFIGAGRTIGEGVERGVDRTGDAYRAHPLAFGAAAAAAGILAGLLLPRTRREDELMGEESDDLELRASRRVRETVAHGAESAAAAARAAGEEAERQGLSPRKVKEKVESAVREGARAAKEEGKEPAEEKRDEPGPDR